MALDENKRRILEGIRERYGDVALPPNPDSMPDDYWREAAQQLASQPAVRDGQPSFMERALGAVTAPFRAFDAQADSAMGRVSPLHQAYKYLWSPAYDAAIQPTLDRAEDVGEFIGSPLVQQFWDARPGGPSPGALPMSPQGIMDMGNRYRAGAESFFANLFPGDSGGPGVMPGPLGQRGIDFRGAVDRATDAMDLSPNVAGFSGVVFDPTNLIPGRAFTGAPAALGRIGREAGQAGAGAAVRQTGREAVRAAQEFPGALAEDVRDVGRLGAAAGRGLGRVAAEGAQGLAMMPFGVGGVGGGGRRAGGAGGEGIDARLIQDLDTNFSNPPAQFVADVRRSRDGTLQFVYGEGQLDGIQMRVQNPTRFTIKPSEATEYRNIKNSVRHLMSQGIVPTENDIRSAVNQLRGRRRQAQREAAAAASPLDEPGSVAPVRDAAEPSIEEVAAGLPPAQAQRVRDELLSDAPDLVSGPSAFKRAYMEARRAGQSEQQAVAAAFAADAPPAAAAESITEETQRLRRENARLDRSIAKMEREVAAAPDPDARLDIRIKYGLQTHPGFLEEWSAATTPAGRYRVRERYGYLERDETPPAQGMSVDDELAQLASEPLTDYDTAAANMRAWKEANPDEISRIRADLRRAIRKTADTETKSFLREAEKRLGTDYANAVPSAYSHLDLALERGLDEATAETVKRVVRDIVVAARGDTPPTAAIAPRIGDEAAMPDQPPAETPPASAPQDVTETGAQLRAFVNDDPPPPKLGSLELEEALETTPSAPTQPPVTRAEVESAETPEQIQSVITREVIEAADTPADPLSRLPADPPPPSSGGLLPEDAYKQFSLQTEQQQVAEIRSRAMQGEEFVQPIIEGARRVAGDVEAQRLQQMATQDVVPVSPEAPAQATPEPEIPREPQAGEFAGRGGGGGRRGGRGERERFGEGEHGGWVPVPGAGFSIPTLSTAADKIAQMRRSTTWQWMADQLSQRVKGGGAAVRLVNPSGGVEGAPVVTRMKIAQEALRDEVDHNWQPLFAWLDELGSESAVFGQADEAGRVTVTLKGERSGQQAQVYIQQIAENRGRYVLSALQEQWLDRADAVSRVSRDYLKTIGQRFGDFNPGDGSNYTGLLLVAKRNQTGEIVNFGYVPMSDRRGLAGKAAFVKERQYQTLEEALDAGLLPEPSYRRALWVRAGMAGRQAVRARMSAFLAQHLREARASADGSVQVHRGLYERTPRRGETEAWHEAVEERFGGEQFGKAGPPKPVDVSLPPGHHIIDLQLYTERKGLTRKQLRISGPGAEKIAQFAEQLKYEAELRQANWLLRHTARIGHEARLMVLTLDASVFFIQGLSAVLAHPTSLVRKRGKLPTDAVRGFYHALRNPDVANQARAAMMSRFAEEGGYYRHPNLITTYGGYSEFTEALQEGGLARRIPVVGEGLERAGTAFDFVRDIVAVELARFGDEVGMGAAELAEHDRIINAMLGRMSSRSLGVGQDQRMAESVLLLAPQYFRATIGLVARATSGGMSSKMTARMVAKSMGLYMALIAASGYMLGSLRGDSEETKLRDVTRSLNPTAGEWLTVRAGDVRIGFAGMPRALMAFMSEMIVGEEFLTDDQKYSGGLLGSRMSTLGRFFASRPGPALTMAYQATAMRDFMGVDTSPGLGWLRIAMNHGLPISVQEVIETFDAENLPMMLGKTAAAGMGLNVRDLGLTDVRERATAQVFPGKLYGELESWQRDYLNALIAPEIDQLRQRRTASQADAVSSSNIGIISSEAKAEREMKLMGYAADMTMEPGALYFSWVRADSFERGQQDTAGELYDLLFDDRPPDVPENELEQAYADWIAISDEPNRQRRDQLYDQFDRRYPQNTRAGRYIRSKTNRRRVPYALLQRLANYSKAKGVWASVLARHAIMQEELQEAGMPAQQARERADAFSNWFLMVDDLAEYQAQVVSQFAPRPGGAGQRRG